MSAIGSRLRWLVTPRGLVPRGEFVAWGCGLMAAKMLIDWLLCTFVVGVQWQPGIYLYVPIASQRGGVGDWGWLLLGAISVPFAWVGLTMTTRRMRDAGLNPWLVVLFVLPIVNLVLFAALSLLPHHEHPRPRGARPRPAARSPLEFGPVPALLAMVATGMVLFVSVVLLEKYATALFVGAPFLQGMIVGVLTRDRDVGHAFGQFFLGCLLTVALLVSLAWEGLVCIAMAGPLWVLMGIAGLCLARTLVAQRVARVVPALLVVPLAQIVEPHLLPPPTVREVRSERLVAAPPAIVWKYLIGFPELPPPTELPFRVGIAYPIHATIEGRGPGAIRRCSFCTGDFVEPIEVWDEPRRLAFSVAQNPPPMVEWNPLHDHVDAPHLHGTFQAHRGQFELQELPDGTTRLIGTTWYAHGLWPETYWGWWSDWLVHTIHGRVLEHIGRCAEADVR